MSIIIKEYNRIIYYLKNRLKKSQIVYFNYFVSVFRVLLSINSGKGVGKVHLFIIYTLS